MGSKEIDLNQCESLVDSSNFALWKFDLFILLKAANLDGVVLGTDVLAETASEKDKREWNQRDAKAQKYIVFTIDKRNKVHIMNSKTSAEMFTSLSKLFDQDDERQKCTAMEEFFTFQYDSTVNMHTNLGKLENIVCKINAVETKIGDDMYMARILSILPDSFHPHFGTAWDSTAAAEKNPCKSES